MSSVHLRYFLSVTDDLSDAELEQTIAEIRAVRQARREGIAVERAMHDATMGLSTAWAERHSPDGVRRSLIASYAAAGLTPTQIDQRMRELDGRR